MTAAMTEAVITSALPDRHDAAFAEDIVIDSIEYARIMRGIGTEDESLTPVSAFNSSI